MSKKFSLLNMTRFKYNGGKDFESLLIDVKFISKIITFGCNYKVPSNDIY